MSAVDRQDVEYRRGIPELRSGGVPILWARP